MKPAVTHLLYLHGFRSSPQSAKAVRVAREIESLRRGGRDIVWCCPQLPPSPSDALALIAHLTDGWPADDRMGVIGSSLGGWYATVVAEARHCRAVLLNPAVNPARDLEAEIGEQTAWHDPELKFSFTAEHVDALRVLTPPAVTRPGRYAAVIAKGDEVLDWHEMTGRYPGAAIRLLEGGDHAISDFDAHLPFVLDFLGLG